MTTTALATLTSTAKGEAKSVFKVAVGDYIWHNGAFRRVTAIDRDTWGGPSRLAIRMGRFVLRPRFSMVAEVATREMEAGR